VRHLAFATALTLIAGPACAAASAGELKEGDAAPGFSTKGDDGKEYSLASLKGRTIVLYFYPQDDTPGCTIEACEFRDANETITERGADVWGISPQGAPSKKAFREKFGLPFTLLADERHEVAEAYGSWVEKQNYGKTYWGTARTTFLVDPDGRIARTWPRVKPEGHAADVLAALDEAQAATATSR
jgi:peroxiredoxin Q/BCP